MDVVVVTVVSGVVGKSGVLMLLLLVAGVAKDGVIRATVVDDVCSTVFFPLPVVAAAVDDV